MFSKDLIKLIKKSASAPLAVLCPCHFYESNDNGGVETSLLAQVLKLIFRVLGLNDIQGTQSVTLSI